MDWASLIVPIVSGIAGGNLAGAALKKFSLGPVGNTILGLIGGAIGGAWLQSLGSGPTSGPVPGAVVAGSFDVGTLVAGIAGGGVGGALLMSVIGVIREKFFKRT
ncbi:hypothetical protein D3C87_339720 [compost metagenome]